VLRKFSDDIDSTLSLHFRFAISLRFLVFLVSFLHDAKRWLSQGDKKGKGKEIWGRIFYPDSASVLLD
jgi:hypothetical protein